MAWLSNALQPDDSGCVPVCGMEPSRWKSAGLRWHPANVTVHLQLPPLSTPGVPTKPRWEPPPPGTHSQMQRDFSTQLCVRIRELHPHSVWFTLQGCLMAGKGHVTKWTPGSATSFLGSPADEGHPLDRVSVCPMWLIP